MANLYTHQNFLDNFFGVESDDGYGLEGEVIGVTIRPEDQREMKFKEGGDAVDIAIVGTEISRMDMVYVCLGSYLQPHSREIAGERELGVREIDFHRRLLESTYPTRRGRDYSTFLGVIMELHNPFDAGTSLFSSQGVRLDHPRFPRLIRSAYDRAATYMQVVSSDSFKDALAGDVEPTRKNVRAICDIVRGR